MKAAILEKCGENDVTRTGESRCLQLLNEAGTLEGQAFGGNG